jgi:hypothetical protein
MYYDPVTRKIVPFLSGDRSEYHPRIKNGVRCFLLGLDVFSIEKTSNPIFCITSIVWCWMPNFSEIKCQFDLPVSLFSTKSRVTCDGHIGVMGLYKVNTYNRFCYSLVNLWTEASPNVQFRYFRSSTANKLNF